MYTELASSSASPHDGTKQAAALGWREPSAVRYVKLGPGGMWASEAFAKGIIPFGFRPIAHALCEAGDWDEVRRQFATSGRSKGRASQGVRELRDIYERDENCLWFTIADGHLYWAFADPTVVALSNDGDDEPRRYRSVRGQWARSSLTGAPLTVRSLSSALLRTASYRMTICRVDREDYLLRRIRGEVDPLHSEAEALRTRQIDIASRMIADLDWRDFEILIDLILTRSGWRHGSAIGDGEVDVDLMLDNPCTGEMAWVQIKSRATQTILDDYIARFERDGICQRFFFTCHSPTGVLTLPDRPGLHLWTGLALADVTIRAGLFDWLLDRTR